MSMNHSLKERVRNLEKEAILYALQECNWVMAKAARSLGITERMIGYKIKKYNIRKEESGNAEITMRHRIQEKL